MIVIRPLTTSVGLSELLATQPLEPFLQSWAWGEFQVAVGRKIWRLGAFNNDALVGAALVIEHELILGQRYLYCPRGPIATSSEVLQALYLAIRKQGDDVGAMYVKIDPPHYQFSFSVSDFPSGFKPGTTLQPRHTMVIDTSKSPAEVLAQMHQKTRYNIRLAEKRGVTVRWSNDQSDFAIFLDLIERTYARQGIRTHSRNYYQKLFFTLSAAGMVNLVIAEFEGQALAANLVIWHQKTATYLHGGSSDHHKEMMAPHVLQWATIQEAHRRGVQDYDLWGAAPTGEVNHKLAGVTRFKEGFGGQLIEFPPAANVILQPQWYWAYRMAKRMRGGVDV